MGGEYDFDGPLDAVDGPEWWQGSQPSDVEISTATAHLECRQQTNLVGIWYAVEVAYQEQLIEQNAQALATFKAAFDTRARNVAAVLADHGMNPS